MPRPKPQHELDRYYGGRKLVKAITAHRARRVCKANAATQRDAAIHRARLQYHTSIRLCNATKRPYRERVHYLE